jgi:hypothetical protein
MYSRDKFILIVNVMLDDFMYILKKCYSVVKKNMDELWGGSGPPGPPPLSTPLNGITRKIKLLRLKLYL